MISQHKVSTGLTTNHLKRHGTMVFDLNAQMKLVQSITQLTMKNMSTAVENAAAQAGASKPTPNNNPLATNPFAQMMDPANWAQMMQPASFAGLVSTPSPTTQSLWWPLNPSFLSNTPPMDMGMSNLGLPNMAIPLGLNPFGKNDTSSFSLPILSAQSPLASGNASEWPDMFWWLVQNEDKAAPSQTDKSAAPWAMIMDPFGLIDEPQPEPEEIPQEDPSSNLFEMMFDPFGLMKSDKVEPGNKKKRSVKTRQSPTPPPPTPEIFPNTVDYLDPFGFMKAQSGNSVTGSEGTGGIDRNTFFGFQPNAQHPLMNDGRPTGMFYLAIALPKDIANINPQLPPWNLAL